MVHDPAKRLLAVHGSPPASGDKFNDGGHHTSAFGPKFGRLQRATCSTSCALPDGRDSRRDACACSTCRQCPAVLRCGFDSFEQTFDEVIEGNSGSPDSSAALSLSDSLNGLPILYRSQRPSADVFQLHCLLASGPAQLSSSCWQRQISIHSKHAAALLSAKAACLPRSIRG